MTEILDLAAVEQGDAGAAAPPVLVLHGLFGSARNWSTIARRLAPRRRVLALDLRNHGGSPWASAMSYEDMANDVRAFIERRGIAPVALVGHSMGGKAAMLLALRAPALVERLVVVDVAPVRYPPTLASYVDAMRAVDLRRATKRAEIDAALSASVPETGVRQFLLQNLVAEDGRLRWRLNLDAIGAAMDDISGFPAVPADAVYDGPALFIAGARSDYVRPEHRATIRRLFPKSALVKVRDAGHWVHAERPEAFLDTLLPFLDAAAATPR